MPKINSLFKNRFKSKKLNYSLKSSDPTYRDKNLLIGKTQVKFVGKKPLYMNLHFLNEKDLYGRSLLKSAAKSKAVTSKFSTIFLKQSLLKKKDFTKGNLNCSCLFSKDVLYIDFLSNEKWKDHNVHKKSLASNKSSSDKMSTINNSKDVSNLLKVYSDVVKFAKENKIKTICCDTWIFSQHPLLAKKLGFELFYSGNFENIMKKNNVKKILGLELNRLSNAILHFENKMGAKKKINLKNIPRWIKKL